MDTPPPAESTLTGLPDPKALQTFLDAAPDAMILVDPSGRITELNSQVETLFGYGRGELTGQPVELLVPESLRASHAEHMRDYLSRPRRRPMGIGMDLLARRKDGSEFPVEISLNPMETSHGICVLAALRDVTQRKQAQEALRLSEVRYRQLVNDVTDYAICRLDPEGRIQSWNTGAESITGYSEKEAVGQHVSFLYSREDVERGLPEMELRGAEDKGRHEHEGWRIRKDGSRFWAVDIATALRDAASRLVGYSKIVRDITAKKRIREDFLLEMTNVLVSNLDIRKLTHGISACLGRLKEHDYASLTLSDPSTQALRVHPLDAPEDSPELQEETVLALDTPSPSVRAFQTGEPVVLGTTSPGPGRPPFPPRLSARGLRSGCWLPLAGRERVLGTLNLASRSEGAFTEQDVALLTQFASQVALALDNALAFRQVTQLSQRLAEEKLYLQDELRTTFDFHEIIGRSRVIRRVLRQVETVAPTDSTVLILGETGTGKELVARAIHDLSPRRGNTFVRVSCAAIPAGLLESELFGHERGAFTGAISQRIGRFELADKGTLFLDEVGDMPLELQAKVLRALQEKEFERVGGTRTLHADARIVAATNRDLEKMVAAGDFRIDLFYRLNVFPIVVPPLRERLEDLPVLVQYFLNRHAQRMKKKIESVPSEALEALARYHWPGNVRELEHLIERAVILSTGAVLEIPPIEPAPGHKSQGSPAGSLESVEREHIVRVLRETQGRIAGPGGAAERLGMNRSTLNSRMRKLGISRKAT